MIYIMSNINKLICRISLLEVSWTIAVIKYVESIESFVSCMLNPLKSVCEEDRFKQNCRLTICKPAVVKWTSLQILFLGHYLYTLWTALDCYFRISGIWHINFCYYFIPVISFLSSRYVCTKIFHFCNRLYICATGLTAILLILFN